AETIGKERGVDLSWTPALDQPAVPMDRRLIAAMRSAAARAGVTPPVMPSGAGHDAMVLAQHIPAAMLFVRSPGGISHHPDESVREDDVATAIAVGRELVIGLAEHANA